MKKFVILVAATIFLITAVGCVTTVPEKNYHTSNFKKAKSCKE